MRARRDRALGTLASLGVSLAHVPPFLLTGLALLIGSLPSWPLARQWRVPPATLMLGIYGLFGFHFLLFIALRHAPPVEANLVNYLWPLFIVVLAPLFLRGVRLRAVHVLAALVGFAGAVLAIVGGRDLERRPGLGLPAGARLGVHLGQLLAADQARGALSHCGDRAVRPGFGRAVARLPCAAGAGCRASRCATCC